MRLVSLLIAACFTAAPVLILLVSGFSVWGALGGALSAAHAQQRTLPCRAVTIIVDSGVGSGTDVIMRAFAEEVNRRGGTLPPFQVINRTGRQTLSSFANETGNGCKLLAVTQSIVAERLAREITLDWGDLTPVAGLTRSPLVLAARTDLEPKPLPEILQALRDEPGKFTVGETRDVLDRFFLRMLEDAASVSFRRKSYDTSRQRYTALLSKNLDLSFISVLGAKRRADEGELVPLAVTSRIRFPLAEDIPTLMEEDIPIDFNVDRGLLAPPNTSPDRIDALAKALGAAATSEELHEKLRNEGTWIRYLSTENYTRYFENLSADWRELLARTGRGQRSRAAGGG